MVLLIVEVIFSLIGSEVIFQTRVGILPNSKYRRIKFKNEAKPSIFNEFQGI